MNIEDVSCQRRVTLIFWFELRNVACVGYGGLSVFGGEAKDGSWGMVP